MASSELPLAARGLVSGLAFGLAVATVHVAVGIGLVLSLGQPPHSWFAFQALLMEIALGGLVGALLTPVFLAPRFAAVIHPALLGLIWLGMERWVAVDPSKPLMWLAGPVVGLALLAAAFRAPRSWAAGLAGGALLLNLVLIAIPEAKHRLTVAPEVEAVDRPAAKAGAPDVLFIVMDTVRAQSSSTYGYERETTPNLTRLAQEGLRFAEATTAGTWSLPAHASLFTGTYPSVHNAHDETRYLDGKLPTVAEVFRQAGYETRCFSANPHISDAFGLTRGFDSSDKAWSKGDGARQFTFIYRIVDRLGFGGATDKGGSMVVGNVQEWMDNRPKDGPPAFVFVNFLEAHFPFEQLPEEHLTAYQDRPMSVLREAGQLAFGAQMGRVLTAEEAERIRQPIVDLYDGGVRYTDELVGRIVDIWRKEGKLDDTVLVVLGDHGEVVGEHRAFGHMSAVVEEDLRVPLVFRYPKSVPAGQVVAHPVSTVGVLATLTDLADVPTPPSAQVPSLMGTLPDTSACAGLADEEERRRCNVLAQARAEEVGLPVIAERYEEHLLSSRFAPGTSNGVGPLVIPHGRYRTYRSGPYKLVQHCTAGTFLFDLRKGETEDLAPTMVEKVAELEAEVLQYAIELKMPSICGQVAKVDPPKNMGKEETCSLCALGYVEGDQCQGCP